MDLSLEVIPVPVSDTDRAKDFYANKVGFNVDMDVRMDENTRFVQLTPPGSHCSIHIGDGMSKLEPGTIRGLILVVDDAAATRTALAGKGVDVSEIEEQPWGRHVYFSDPDGNSWTIQESFARNEKRAAEQAATAASAP